MKKASGFKEGAAVRFELIDLDPIYEKDGMKKHRHSRVRMFQATRRRDRRSPSASGWTTCSSSRAAGPYLRVARDREGKVQKIRTAAAYRRSRVAAQ